MGDFGDGFNIAERLIACERRLAEHDARWLEHELSAGAHASAFDAHGASPGVVENAEETAEAIVEHAADVAGDVGEIPIEGAEHLSDATGESVDAVTEAIEDAAETIADAVETVAPEGGGEREPANVHFLQRKWFDKGAA